MLDIRSREIIILGLYHVCHVMCSNSAVWHHVRQNKNRETNQVKRTKNSKYYTKGKGGKQTREIHINMKVAAPLAVFEHTGDIHAHPS